MREVWVDVKGYEGLYKVSNSGRVKSVKRVNSYGRSLKERILKSKSSKQVYNQVCLSKEGVREHFYNHKLVAEVFIPNPNHKLCVNHKDGIKINNEVDNLEWCTHLENTEHACQQGLRDNKGEKHPNSILTEDEVKCIKDSPFSGKELASIYGVSAAQISHIKRGKHWKHL